MRTGEGLAVAILPLSATGSCPHLPGPPPGVVLDCTSPLDPTRLPALPVSSLAASAPHLVLSRAMSFLGVEGGLTRGKSHVPSSPSPSLPPKADRGALGVSLLESVRISQCVTKREIMIKHGTRTHSPNQTCISPCKLLSLL